VITPSPFVPLRWGFVFVRCPVTLSEKQRDDLVGLAIRAYMEDLPKVDFDWEECRGTVEVGSDAVSIGSFYGQLFSADVHVPSKSGRVEFLVTEAQMKAVRHEMAEA